MPAPKDKPPYLPPERLNCQPSWRPNYLSLHSSERRLILSLSMEATNWEFRNRALLFGLIFAFSFPLYSLDHQNATAAVANWLGPRLRMNADLVAHALFAVAALLLVGAALIRTWASAYLR